VQPVDLEEVDVTRGAADDGFDKRIARAQAPM